MSALGHWVDQNKDVLMLKSEAVAPPPEVRRHADRPCIEVYGRQIEALHLGGMKLVDIARQLGLNYNGLRGIYSRYRRIKQQIND